MTNVADELLCWLFWMQVLRGYNVNVTHEFPASSAHRVLERAETWSWKEELRAARLQRCECTRLLAVHLAHPGPGSTPMGTQQCSISTELHGASALCVKTGFAFNLQNALTLMEERVKRNLSYEYSCLSVSF